MGTKIMPKNNLGPCQVANCPSKAYYLIGSLKREMRGQSKFLHVCETHERAIAEENGEITVQAKEAGMTTIENVSRGG